MKGTSRSMVFVDMDEICSLRSDELVNEDKEGLSLNDKG